MQLKVRVHPHSKHVHILCSYDQQVRLDVYLTEPAENNKANLQLVKVLKKAFCCDVSLVRGHRSKEKIVTLDMSEDDFSGFAKKFSNEGNAREVRD